MSVLALLLVLLKTILVSIPEETFIVLFILIISTRFGIFNNTVNGIKINKNYIFRTAIPIIVTAFLSDLVRYIDINLAGIVSIAMLFIIPLLICLTHRIRGWKNIGKTFLFTMLAFLVLMVCESYIPLVMTVAHRTVEEVNVMVGYSFLLSIPERIIEFCIICFLVMKKFNLYKINIINPIKNNKFLAVLVSVVITVSLALITFLEVIFVCTKILFGLAIFTQIMINVAIISFALINLIALFGTIYYLTNQKLDDKISVKDRLYLLNNFMGEITNAIGSAFNINEFLKNVNSMIIKTMNVKHSTIILFNQDKTCLEMKLTNIKNLNSLKILEDNLNCQQLLNVFNNNASIIDNDVDVDEYDFTKGREIASLICVPIYNKTQNFGLILIEDNNYNSFDEENVKMVNIIGQQIGFALENIQLYNKNQELMDLDYLTNVYNRHHFQKILHEKFAESKQFYNRLSLVMLDIDYFKKVNDTYGHLFGDEVLKHMANIVKSNIRKDDIIARYGGEEFVIILPKTDSAKALEITERLRAKVEESFIYFTPQEDKGTENAQKVYITASFGIATYPDNAESEIELMYNADKALYNAKHSGRNCVKVFEE